MQTQPSAASDRAPWEAYVVPAPRDVILPRPVSHEVVVERGLRIPMLDSVELAGILWRPLGPGPWPVLIERCPHRLEERGSPAGDYHAGRGIAVLCVGMRGCAGSDGEFSGTIPGSPVGDGYDTVEWAAAQPWCDGRAGLICGSISGLTAYQTAVEAPPHLIPSLVREGPLDSAWLSSSCRSLLAAQWVTVAWAENRLSYLPPAQRARLQTLVDTWQQEMQEAMRAAAPDSPFQPVPNMLRHLPLTPHPLLSPAADYYDDWLGPSDPSTADATLLHNVHQVSVPICHLGAWFDGILRDTVAAFCAMQARARTAGARSGQRLIVGPWVHGPFSTHGKPVGLLEFGPNAELDFFAFRQRWYDAHLTIQSDRLEEPVVWLYLIGPDRWLGFDSWPPPVEAKALYLITDGLAEAPAGVPQEPDTYEYDPNDPVPSLAGGGAMGIGLDQRPVEDRLLTYTSPPLEAQLTLAGPVKTILYASSSAPDTDWIVRLTMVRPDGASVILSGGTVRARYHRSPTKPVRLEPHRPERFEIEMMPVSIVIPTGCALRLTVTSSDFPAFDRNLNTGGPIGRESVGQVAVNRIYHDAQLPSHVVLPVLRPG
jgi:uncharacterized protein